MTGKHPIHTGMQHTVLFGAEPRGLPLTEKLLPQHLKELGYTTRIVGKWHLGSYRKEYTPLYRGFDSHLGNKNSRMETRNRKIHRETPITFLSPLLYELMNTSLFLFELHKDKASLLKQFHDCNVKRYVTIKAVIKIVKLFVSQSICSSDLVALANRNKISSYLGCFVFFYALLGITEEFSAEIGGLPFFATFYSNLRLK